MRDVWMRLSRELFFQQRRQSRFQLGNLRRLRLPGAGDTLRCRAAALPQHVLRPIRRQNRAVLGAP
jgi:hypothetical protein